MLALNVPLQVQTMSHFRWPLGGNGKTRVLTCAPASTVQLVAAVNVSITPVVNELLCFTTCNMVGTSLRMNIKQIIDRFVLHGTRRRLPLIDVTTTLLGLKPVTFLLNIFMFIYTY